MAQPGEQMQPAAAEGQVEVGGQRGTAKLRLAAGWSAQKVNVLGEPLGAPLRGTALEFAPYEIISLRLSRRG
jgi:alpha-mannosidase